MRQINRIIVHCSDSPDSMAIGFREINNWHKENGWLDKKSGVSCGYHYIVKRNGKVEIGRPEGSVGAHCYGKNRTSIGICWVGREKMTPAQNRAILKLTQKLRFKHNVQLNRINGHCEFDDKKTCPNFNMDQFRLDVLFTAVGK